MSPARRGIPAALRSRGGLTLLLLLLLLLCPQAARSDCSLPPDVPNAQPALDGLTSFPEQSIVAYKCDKGFVKIPGKPDSVICLKGDEWSQIAEFCNRSCDFPTRLPYASLKQPYKKQSYFPVGSTVEYECRMGYTRDPSLSGKLTCLQNLTWSKLDEFCRKKSCPHPGEIINGHISITTDILLGASITFSCNTGYKLVGPTSSDCILVGKSVDWSDPLPECQESSQMSRATPTPQKPSTVNNPSTKAPPAPQKPTTISAPATKATPTPQNPTTVNILAPGAPSTLQKSTTVNISSTKAPSTSQKPTTVNILTTEASSIPQKSITANSSATTAKIAPVSNTLSLETPAAAQTPLMANISAIQVTVTQKSTVLHDPVAEGLNTTQRLTSARITATQSHAVPRTTTRFHTRTTPFPATTTPFRATATPFRTNTLPAGVSTIASGLVAGTLVIGTLILVKIFWDYGKSGSYYTREDSKAQNVMFHNLTVTTDASGIRPSGHTFITLTVLLMTLVVLG